MANRFGVWVPGTDDLARKEAEAANVPELAKFIVDDYQEMDPTKPEPPPAYLKQSPGPGGRAPVPPEPGTRPPRT